MRDAGKLGWKMGLVHTYDVCEMQVNRYKSKEECVELLMHVRVIWVTWLCVKLASRWTSCEDKMVFFEIKFMPAFYSIRRYKIIACEYDSFIFY